MSHQIRQVEIRTVNFTVAENGVIPITKVVSFESTYRRPPIVVISTAPTTAYQDINAWVKNITTIGFVIHTSDQYLGAVKYIAYETE